MFKRTDTDLNASIFMQAGAKVYDERNKEYGDAFIIVGKVMNSIFPNGVNLESEEDFRRFHLFEWMIGKIVRYAQNFEKGGHEDSIKDAMVYASMLAFEDSVIEISKQPELPLEVKR